MKFKAVTIQSQAGPFAEIITKVGVSPSLGHQENPNATYWTSCLWDTGGTHSSITKKTAEELSLQPEGEARVLYGNGEAITKFYIVSLTLPDLMHLPAIRVTEAATNEGFGVIIGMDVISLGDFAMTNVGGVSTFSFCVPGLEVINFQERIADMEQGNED